MNNLPFNLEVEQAVLGCIFLNPQALDKVVDFLRPEHFYEDVHGRIYQAMLECSDAGRLPSAKLLMHDFKDDEALADVGGAVYLLRLQANAPAPLHTADYARQIVSFYTRRQIIFTTDELREKAIKESAIAKPETMVAEAEQALFNLVKHQTGGVVSFADSLSKVIDMADTAMKAPDGLSGLDTGFRDLNNKIGGLHNSDLMILAGRPAMGKSALAANIAFHVAKSRPVAFFSLEMSHDQLSGRLLAGEANIDSNAIRNGRLNKDQFNRLMDARKRINDLPLFIDDTPALTIQHLRALVRRQKRKNSISMVIVDYLQLMTGQGNGNVEIVTNISKGLKAIAKEFDIPVLALSQLSRAVEQRENKRPLLSDLRESGSIEQDADQVWFVYRHEYYLEREEPKIGTEAHSAWVDELNANQGMAELIIAKQRHGPTGTINLRFTKETTTFEDVE